jgi:DNA-binding MarR family transcriptional regulator
MARRARGTKAVETSVDAESRVHDDHHVSLRLLLRLLACTGQVEKRVRQFLQTKFQTSIARFDLMAQLERTAEGLNMYELSQRLMVTRGNVTGITDALESEGLVVRAVDAVDRRVFRVKLTAEGQRQFARMAREHERYIIDLFGGMSAKNKRQLMELLSELKHLIGSSER